MHYILSLLCFLNIFLLDIKKIDAQDLVTNPERSDGFGAQYQTIIISAIYAELLNKKFVYSPFKNMEHNYNNDPDFLTKKEWLINFIDNFEINNGCAEKFEVGALINFFEDNLDQCIKSDVLKKIKHIFKANKNINNYFNNRNLNIVVHIRRHNEHDSRIDGTNIPNKIFLDIINQLRIIYAKENPLFHIHSQGNEKKFKIFQAPDIVFHLDESIEDSFAAMVFADVLIVGTSSFSYTAGILSDGLIYYLPFWHKPLPNWICVDMLLKKD